MNQQEHSKSADLHQVQIVEKLRNVEDIVKNS